MKLFSPLLCILSLLSPFASDRIHHAKVSVTPCDTKQLTTYEVVVTDLTPSAEELKQRVSRLILDSKDAGKSTVTIRSDANGWPVDCKVTGAGAEADGQTLMLFLLRKPLWTGDAKQAKWIASIVNPFDNTKKLEIACRLVHPQPWMQNVQVEQRSELIPVISGMNAQFTSILDCNSIGGKVQRLHIKIEVKIKEKDGQLMEYQESN
jgi:hypothetical protein